MCAYLPSKSLNTFSSYLHCFIVQAVCEVKKLSLALTLLFNRKTTWGKAVECERKAPLLFEALLRSQLLRIFIATTQWNFFITLFSLFFAPLSNVEVVTLIWLFAYITVCKALRAAAAIAIEYYCDNKSWEMSAQKFIECFLFLARVFALSCAQWMENGD